MPIPKELTQDDMYFTEKRQISLVEAVDKLRINQNKIIEFLKHKEGEK